MRLSKKLLEERQGYLRENYPDVVFGQGTYQFNVLAKKLGIKDSENLNLFISKIVAYGENEALESLLDL